MNVNGKDVKTLSCNSGGWGSVASAKLTVTLQQGENTVRLYGKSSSAWMPNVDCMTITPVGTTERVAVGIASPAAPSTSDLQQGSDAYYTLSGQATERPEKGFYIHKGRKILKK